MKVIVLLISLFLSNILTAQIYRHRANVTGAYSLGVVDTASYNCGSLRAEVFVSNYVGLNWNLDFLYRNDQIRQIHATMGLVGGPILMLLGVSKSEDGDSTKRHFLTVLGVLLLVFPDGISFHLPVGASGDFSPYINIIGIDFIRSNTTGESNIKYACSFGTKYSYVHNDRITFSVFGETRKAGGVPWSVGGGLGVGLLLGKR